MIRVSCLGPEGTVSHEALSIAAEAAGADVDALLLGSIHLAVAAVTEGEADFALVPMENSLEGGVSATLDSLLAGGGMTPIVGELIHPVAHRLVAKDELALSEITAVHSLPFVADQCSTFLRASLPQARIIPATSTADAVRTVSRSEDTTIAALGSELAARLNRCQVIAEQVDDGGNSTRFVWLAADSEGDPAPGVDPSQPSRTSIVFWGSGAGEPGWLVDCLAEFGSRGVNLSRIESRPRREGLGSYVFFADLEGSVEDENLESALEGLAGRAEAVRLLGSYPAAASTA
jgi:prephenate dehydratase